MTVWELYLPKGMSDFLTERGVDLPRAWYLHVREMSSKGLNDNRLGTFSSYLRREYPVECVAWRILKGEVL